MAIFTFLYFSVDHCTRFRVYISSLFSFISVCFRILHFYFWKEITLPIIFSAWLSKSEKAVCLPRATGLSSKSHNSLASSSPNSVFSSHYLNMFGMSILPCVDLHELPPGKNRIITDLLFLFHFVPPWLVGFLNHHTVIFIADISSGPFSAWFDVPHTLSMPLIYSSSVLASDVLYSIYLLRSCVSRCVTSVHG